MTRVPRRAPVVPLDEPRTFGASRFRRITSRRAKRPERRGRDVMKAYPVSYIYFISSHKISSLQKEALSRHPGCVWANSRRWICRRRGCFKARALVRTPDARLRGVPSVHRAPSSRPVARIDIDGSAGRLPVESQGTASAPLYPFARASARRTPGVRHTAPSKDPESGEKKNIKRTLSSGKLLVDDPGWLGPFNRLVWAYPNSILYSLLILGAVIFVLMKQAHHSTNAVRSTRRERPSKKGSFLSTTNATRARSLRRVATRRRLERVRTRAPRRDAPFRRARVAREPSRNSPRAPRGLRPHTARAVCSLLFPPSDGTGAFLFHLFVRARVSPLTRLPPPPSVRGRGDRGGAVVYGQHLPVPPDFRALPRSSRGSPRFALRRHARSWC